MSKVMVGSRRLELPTSSVSRKRSNQLSYEPGKHQFSMRSGSIQNRNDGAGGIAFEAIINVNKSGFALFARNVQQLP